MKIIVVSDIHGDSIKFKKIVEFMVNEQIDQMIILGDLFNNYYELNVASKEISNLLWNIASKVVIIRGNCDSLFDQTLLPVNFIDSYQMVIGKRRGVFFHGHKMPPSNSSYRLYCQGHTHVCRLDIIDNIIYMNPGSLSRPRDYTIGSFGVITDNLITIMDLNYQILYEMKI